MTAPTKDSQSAVGRPMLPSLDSAAAPPGRAQYRSQSVVIGVLHRQECARILVDFMVVLFF